MNSKVERKYRFVVVALSIGTAFLLGAGWLSYSLIRKLPEADNEVATVAVERGDVTLRLYGRGELHPSRSVMLVTPNLLGGAQLVRIASQGSFARKGDLIAEFSAGDVESKLETAQLELQYIDQQIRKAEADSRLRLNQGQLDLLAAQYAVRRAELESRRREFVSVSQSAKNAQALEDARARLAQIAEEIKARQEQSRNEIMLLRAKHTSVAQQVNEAKGRVSERHLIAPMDGLVIIAQNPSNSISGTLPANVHEGDQLDPGAPVAEIVDLSEMDFVSEMRAEDAALLQGSESASLRLDAAPMRTIAAKIRSIGQRAGINSQTGVRVVFGVNMSELFATLGVQRERLERILSSGKSTREKEPERENPAGTSVSATPTLPLTPAEASQVGGFLRPGLLGNIEITIAKVSKAIHIPLHAATQKDHQWVAYVRTDTGFEERVFTLLKRDDSMIVVAKGLDPNEVIAIPSSLSKAKERIWGL